MRVFIITFFAAFLMTTSSHAQHSAIKSGVYLFGHNGVLKSVLDLGFEVRFAKKWTGQASLTYSSRYSDDEINKRLISFQVRRYNKENFTNSLFGGFVVQKYLEKGQFYYVSNDKYTQSDISDNRWGIGIITGYQFKVFQRLGLDIHGGLLVQNGNIKSIYKLKSNAPDETKTEKIAFKLRPFWGLNLYVALGQMPESKSKKK